MKGFIALMGLLVLMVGIVQAESRSSTAAPAIDTCTVTLTKQQVEQVKNARGKETTVNLNNDQQKLMQTAFPGWKGTSVKIAQENLFDNGKVLFWRERVMEANPQPSPYPVPEDLQRLIEEANPQPSP